MPPKATRKSGRSHAISDNAPVNASRKRARSSSERTIGTKSRYWKDEKNETPDEQLEAIESSNAEEGSDFEGDPSLESAPGSESELSSEDDISDEEEPKRKRKTTTKKATQTAPTKGKQGNELWRQGVRTGLAPGTQVIIKKPKPRAAGKTSYADSTLHPNTLLFLEDLKINNDREWLKSERFLFLNSPFVLCKCPPKTTYGEWAFIWGGFKTHRLKFKDIEWSVSNGCLITGDSSQTAVP